MIKKRAKDEGGSAKRRTQASSGGRRRMLEAQKGGRREGEGVRGVGGGGRGGYLRGNSRNNRYIVLSEYNDNGNM